MSEVHRKGLFIVGDYNCQEYTEYAKHAEQTGYDSVWLAEDLGFRDGIVPLTALSVSTSRIKLGTGILPIGYRNPALTAMTAATLDELSCGRLILGLGIGAPRFLAALGIDSSNSIDELREYIQILRLILKGENVRFSGQFYNLTDVKLAFKPPNHKIPIYLAARRKRMLKLAGEIADGVFLSDGFCSENYIRWAQENVNRGLRKKDRDERDVDFTCAIFLSASVDHAQAKENVKPSVLRVLSRGYLDPFLEMWGLTVADVTPSRDAWIRGNVDEACKKTPDALIDGSAIYGTPDECRKKIERLRVAGVEMPVIRPVGSDIHSAIEAAKNW